ncbi:protein mono-ADP-ribosyltransferase PARP4 isoform X2 [Pleurodeles waltl]|uniref:protein mono-ADP-ribosyltransferase PARP4 isoform X2 n=1 Tax=Pleurodeles waltl TaxID=8319 RepID=UPI0037095FA5
MAAEVFADCVFFLKVNHLPAQDKKRLKAIIKDKGGTISFVLNKKCTHVIAENADALTSRHQQNIKKNHIPIVGIDFIMNLANKITGSCDKSLPEKLDTSCEVVAKNKTPTQGKEHFKTLEESAEKEKKKSEKRVHIEIDPDRVNFHQDLEVAKYAALEKALSRLPSEVAVIELQCLTGQLDLPFQIVVHLGSSNGVQSKLNYFQFETSEEACKKYHFCVKDLKNKGYILRKGVPQDAVHLTSEKLKEMLLQDAINATTVSVEISTFVELIWVEALGHLDHILLHPVNRISLNDVSKAEGVLLQVRKALDKGDTVDTLIPLMSEFYRIIRHKNEKDLDINKKLLSTKETLCQVIRDLVSVCETNLYSPNPPSLAKYHALRCMIQYVNPNSDEFIQLKEQVLQNNHSGSQVTVLNIYRVGRINEAAEFESSLGNIQLLLHASAACNYVGILSRGLLLPKVVVDDHGVERTDIGNLGSGIYFSDSISTSMKYTAPTQTDGSRLLVICEVALGNCLDLNKKDFSLANAPPGYHSVHGIRKAPGLVTDFEDDEYVVYNTSQIKMKYVVQFCTTEDNIKEFCPNVNIAEEDGNVEEHSDLISQTDDNDILDIKPLEEMKAGLLDTSGNPIPLEGVHIKGKILDLIAQVVVFQRYTNRSTVPIEAKYVFPLDSTAAVCGFEAFINGKHIIGEVKEKQEAHREYREAVSQGHGAYLMDQDAPDVFTVSVGNLPPQATVIIKITYVTELSTIYGTVRFMVPGAVAPWQAHQALNENTQDTVEKICIKEGDAKKGAFSLDLAIEMPSKIEAIYCGTHRIKLKKTDCKAVISTEEDSTLDSRGFRLKIQLSDIYLPRMWVEKHPDKESEACMLVFQPDFDTESEEPEFNEVIICLDCSNSMSSVFQQAKKIALFALKMFSNDTSLNIIKFGTSYEEFCTYSRRQSDLELLEKFIKSAKPSMGNTDFWKPLHSLSLLVPSKGIRNILLISDGHIQNESGTFQIVKNNAKHTRLFTCGVGSTVNRHMLRSLAKYGAGAFEYFDEKSKYNWKKKVCDQISRMESEGCNSVSVKWQQFNQNAPEPIQAPAEIQSIFSSERVLVYGFVPHCTQAKLRALLRKQEIETMVSTTELQKTKGTILHKLTARALIRDYEDGILHEKENEHEMRKQMLKLMIIELSKEYSIVTQFTSFVAIEKRDTMESQVDIPNILQLMAAEDIDFLPYMAWEEDPDHRERSAESSSSSDSTEVDHEEDREFAESSSLVNLPEFDYIEHHKTSESSSSSDYMELEYEENLEVAADSYVEAHEAEVPQLKPERCSLAFRRRACDSQEFSSVLSPPPAAEEVLPAPEGLILYDPAPPSLALSESFPSHPPPPPRRTGLAKPLPYARAPQLPSYQSTAPSVLRCPPAAPPSLVLLAPRPAALLAPRPPELGHSLEFSGPLQAGARVFSDVPNAFRSLMRKDTSTRVSFIEPEPRLVQFSAASASSSVGPSLPDNVAFSAGLGSYVGDCSLTPQNKYSVPSIFASSSGTSLFPRSEDKVMMQTGGSVSEIGSGFFGKTSAGGFGMGQMMQTDGAISEIDSGLFGKTSAGGFGMIQSDRHRPSMPKLIQKYKADPNWAHLFLLQTPDHYWELNSALQMALKVDVNYLINVFLVQKGLNSLGPKGKEMVLRLIATLLVLQVFRQAEELSGIRFISLMKLDESSVKTVAGVVPGHTVPAEEPRAAPGSGGSSVGKPLGTGTGPPGWATWKRSWLASDNYWRLSKAIHWARNIDRQYPGICNRLDLGKDWNSATRKLLGIDPIKDSSPLAKAVYAC